MTRTQPTGKAQPDTKEAARLVIALIVLVAIILFAVLNSHEVKVEYIFTSTQTPLIVVILVSALLGAIADRLLIFRKKRKQRN